MAAPAAIVKAVQTVVSALSDKNARKRIGSFLGGAVMLIVLIPCLFLFLLSGLIGLFVNAYLRDNWNLVRNNICDVFESLGRTANSEVKEAVYVFMPDFSVNLSKAAISESYPNELLIYDTAEYETAKKAMNEAAEILRSEGEEGYSKLCSNYGIKYSASVYSAINSDEALSGDVGINNAAEYKPETYSFLSQIAHKKLNTYSYIFEEYTTEDGKEATRQTLTVKGEKLTQIVEYNAIGDVELYLPEFLAMYQTKLHKDVFVLDDDEDGEKRNEAIEDAMGGDFAEAENEEELQEAVDGINSGNKAYSTLNFLEIADLKGILMDSVLDGTVSADIEYESGDGFKKIIITLKAPDVDEWCTAFDIDTDNSQTIGIFEEYQSIIAQTLTNAGVSEADFYLNLDNFFQEALFVYFSGFFNLPVESSELTEHSNGIITKFGDYSNFHTMGVSYAKTIETGVTLKLSDTKSKAKIDLLPSVKRGCIEDIVIYDIWLGGEHDNGEYSTEDMKSVTYDCDMITIAYTIDTERFEKDYGFPFPSPFGETETMNDTITMLVEYSCLCESYYPTISYQVGDSIKDVIEDGNFALGLCHNGITKDAEQNAASNNNWFRHNDNTPHLSIKVAFLNYPSYSGMTIFQTDTNVYSGITGSNNRTDMYLVNPLLWFKGFRTEVDDKTLEGLIAS